MKTIAAILTVLSIQFFFLENEVGEHSGFTQGQDDELEPLDVYDVLSTST